MIEELWQTYHDIEKVVEEYFKYEPKPFLLVRPKKPFPQNLQYYHNQWRKFERIGSQFMAEVYYYAWIGLKSKTYNTIEWLNFRKENGIYKVERKAYFMSKNMFKYNFLNSVHKLMKVREICSKDNFISFDKFYQGEISNKESYIAWWKAMENWKNTNELINKIQ